jgi:hypothetical protein
LERMRWRFSSAMPWGPLGLAPEGVYSAPDVTIGAVSSYFTFSPLPSRAVSFLWHLF